MTFESLGLSARTLNAVRNAGFKTPTPIQQKSIPTIMGGRDLIGIAQTGTGKTAAFALPTIELLKKSTSRGPARALVLSPTRELAAQITDTFRVLSRKGHLRTTSIYGGVSERPQIASLRKGTDIIVATPGRLIDLVDQGHVDLRQLEIVVLDEADRMLDMGFLPAIRKIVAKTPAERQTLMFSATLSKEIERLTSDFQKDPETVEIGSRHNPAETVQQTLFPVSKAGKKALLSELLRDAELASVLVFSRTKHGADKIARNLEKSGVRSERIHSNRSQSQRQRALEAFRSGRARVLVATDIAARGIDVEGITHVVNYDFPPAPEDYIHRIGRTGRANASGSAFSFVTSDDEAAVRGVEKLTKRTLTREKSHQGADPEADVDPKVAQPTPARATRGEHHTRPRNRRGRAAKRSRRARNRSN